jgi:hypothetical protein
MSDTNQFQHRYIVNAVQPLLTELRDAVRVQLYAPQHPERGALESFIQRIFHHSYGAHLNSFYPYLASFVSAGHIRGVVGYRDGMAEPLFSEQYLDAPVESLIGACLAQNVERRHVVEVGNLALNGPGEARWAIAAMTVFLHSAGYRWVLFTAVKSLSNAFQRLGLNPVPIATPDARRLPDGGRQWGSYYQAGPMVYLGNIEAGFRKLSPRVLHGKPRLHALMHDAQRLGRRARPDSPSAMRAAG